MYNAKNAKELEGHGLPKDSIIDGVIINIDDGTVKEFVKDTTKWDNPEGKAINLTIEVKVGESSVKFNELIAYVERDGITSYTKKSKLGKFKGKYNKLPEVGDVVKILTDKEGYGEIKLD
jgi:hypothetical protein